MTKEDALNILLKYGAHVYPVKGLLDKGHHICIDGLWLYYLCDDKLEVEDVMIHYEEIHRKGTKRTIYFNEDFEQKLNEYIKKIKMLKLEIKKIKMEKDFNGAE